MKLYNSTDKFEYVQKIIQRAIGNIKGHLLEIEPHQIVRTAQKSPYGKLNQATNWLRNSSGVSFVLSCIR